MALFRALKKLGGKISLAHVDHGWRPTSGQEAETLRKWAENTPFFLKTLKKEDFQGNLEEDARRKRLQFFHEVVLKTGSKGVLLGHHADDLAETVFKRLLEGTPLYSLEAIKKTTLIDDLLVARPLLDVTKKEILAYLGNTPYFRDETNESDQFLRGRLRNTLFPWLSEAFGKRVEGPLAEMAREASLLSDYLEVTLAPLKTHHTPDGAYLDLTAPLHPYLLQARIDRFLKELSLPTRREEIKALARAIEAKKVGFAKHFGNRQVVADRGVLYAPKEAEDGKSEREL